MNRKALFAFMLIIVSILVSCSNGSNSLTPSLPGPGIPLNPQIAGETPLIHSIQDLEIYGDYAYIIEGHDYLSILDISDPYRPVLVRKMQTAGKSSGILIINNYAVIAGERVELCFYDISDPVNPELIYSLDTDNDYITSMVSNGSAIFVSGVDNHLTVVDASDCRSPVITGQFELFPGIPEDSFLINKYLFMIVGQGGTDCKLNIIDVQDPLNPVLLSTMDFNKIFVIKLVNGQIICSTVTDMGIINIDDSANPVFHVLSDMPGARDMLVDGNYVYLMSTKSFAKYDFSDPWNPQLISENCNKSVTGYDRMHFYKDLIISANTYCGLAIFENLSGSSISCSQPDIPVQQGDVAHVIGDYLYVEARDVENDYKYAVFSVRDLPDISFVKFIKEFKPQNVVSIQDNLVFEVDNQASNNLKIWDASDPLHPVLLSEIGMSELINYICYSDGVIYADSVDSISTFIIDASDIHDPQIVSSIETPGSNCLGVSDGYLVVTHAPFIHVPSHYVSSSFSEGVSIYDTRDPANPLKAGFLEMDNPFHLTVKNRTAYVWNSNNLSIVDFDVITSPVLVGTIEKQGDAGIADIFIQGDYLFSYKRPPKNSQVKIYDISNYSELSELSTIEFPSSDSKPLSKLYNNRMIVLEHGYGIAAWNLW
jgi:hypothetical protein